MRRPCPQSSSPACRRLIAAALLPLVLGLPDTPWAQDPGTEPSPAETRLVIRQHGWPVPLTPDADGVLQVSLDRDTFELLFPRAVFEKSGYQAREPNVRVLISTDPQLFDYIRTPVFTDRVGPAHAYAMPPPGEHYLMLTDVDFANLGTAHNYMVDYRLDIQGADSLGVTVEQIVERDMTDRLHDGPSPLYMVVVIHQERPDGEVVAPGDGPEVLTPALIDYLELDFPDRSALLAPSR